MNLINQYKGLRKEVYILFIGRIVTSLGSMVWPVLTLILNQKLGMDATGIAVFTIVSGAMFIPAGLIGGKLADRCNKKMVIVWFDLISIVFYFICAVMPLSIWTIVVMMVASMFQNLEYPSYNSLLADITPLKMREKAYSLQYLGGNIGMVIAPTIAGFLLNKYLWLSFIISGCSIAISTFLIFFKIKDVTPVVEDDQDAGQYQADAGDANVFEILGANKPILLFYLLMALYQGAYSMYGYLMPLDIARVHGDLGAVIYGSVNSINCITVVIGTPILTRLLSKRTVVEKNLFGQIFLVIGYVIFLVFLGNIPVYYVAMTLFTFGEIMTTISSSPYITQRIPSSHRGRVDGFLNIANGIAYAVIMFAAGRMFDTLGSTVTWIFVLSVLAVSITLCFILIPVDKKRYPALYKTEN